MSIKTYEFHKKKIDSHISSIVKEILLMFILRTEVTFGKTEVSFSTVIVVFWFGINRSDFSKTEVTFGRQECLLMHRSDFFLSRKNRSVFFDDFFTQKCLFP